MRVAYFPAGATVARCFSYRDVTVEDSCVIRPFVRDWPSY